MKSSKQTTPSPKKEDAPYPYFSINGQFLDKELLDDVWKELERKTILFKAGLGTPSKTELFAYEVLKLITTRKLT